MKLVAVASLLVLLAVSGQAAPVCTVALADRQWCGWPGISQGECIAKGCCFEINAKSFNWCFQPAGRNPCNDKPCRSDELCVPDLSGTSYTCTCPGGRGAGGRCNTAADATCALDIDDRQPCGWNGITQDECTQQGCCFQVNTETLFWCYRKGDDQDPCYSYPCRRDEVCIRNGASYACTCSAGRSGTRCSIPPVAQCAISIGNRQSCGWFGISPAQCAERGCCYENNANYINWCYTKKSTPCDSNPCKNGGVCANSGSTYTCTCGKTWGGTDCSTPNPCGSSPCKNGGACSNSGASFTCTCTAGWTGPDCGTASNPCKDNSCHNGGTCVKVTDTTFKCECVPGWTGTDCTTDVNVCKTLPTNPCKNGGTCVKFGDTYQCKCATGWAGDNCEKGSAECLKVPATATTRVNCGWSNIAVKDCNARSCCYDETYKNFAFCYYSDYQSMCDNVKGSEVTNCGWDGITYAQCVGRGCCFDDDEESNPNGPVCFRKSNPNCVGVPAKDRIPQGSSEIFPNVCVANDWCYDTSIPQTEGPWCFTRIVR